MTRATVRIQRSPRVQHQHPSTALAISNAHLSVCCKENGGERGRGGKGEKMKFTKEKLIVKYSEITFSFFFAHKSVHKYNPYLFASVSFCFGSFSVIRIVISYIVYPFHRFARCVNAFWSDSSCGQFTQIIAIAFATFFRASHPSTAEPDEIKTTPHSLLVSFAQLLSMVPNISKFNSSFPISIRCSCLHQMLCLKTNSTSTILWFDAINRLKRILFVNNLSDFVLVCEPSFIVWCLIVIVHLKRRTRCNSCVQQSIKRTRHYQCQCNQQSARAIPIIMTTMWIAVAVRTHQLYRLTRKADEMAANRRWCRTTQTIHHRIYHTMDVI